MTPLLYPRERIYSSGSMSLLFDYDMILTRLARAVKRITVERLIDGDGVCHSRARSKLYLKAAIVAAVLFNALWSSASQGGLLVLLFTQAVDVPSATPIGTPP